MSTKDQYDVLETIGTGSFGTVCKIKRKSDDKILVWKEINFGTMSEKEKSQLVSEVNIIRELDNPFIVKYYDRIVDKAKTRIYIIMEYCSNGDLGKLISKCRRDRTSIDEGVIWKVFAQSLVALKNCHRRVDENGAKKPTIHRDLKPANVLLDCNQNIKIADFGLAKELSSNTRFAQTNVGTPLYMAPEIINEKDYDERADIWSLGCVLYELASLRPPFDAQNAMSLAMKINTGKFPRIPPRYSDSLFNAIKGMLSLDPRKRSKLEELEEIPAIQCALYKAKGMLFEHTIVQNYASKQKELLNREQQLKQREEDLRRREKLVEDKERDMQWRAKNLEAKSTSSMVTGHTYTNATTMALIGGNAANSSDLSNSDDCNSTTSITTTTSTSTNGISSCSAIEANTMSNGSQITAAGFLIHCDVSHASAKMTGNLTLNANGGSNVGNNISNNSNNSNNNWATEAENIQRARKVLQGGNVNMPSAGGVMGGIRPFGLVDPSMNSVAPAAITPSVMQRPSFSDENASVSKLERENSLNIHHNIKDRNFVMPMHKRLIKSEEQVHIGSPLKKLRGNIEPASGIGIAGGSTKMLDLHSFVRRNSLEKGNALNNMGGIPAVPTVARVPTVPMHRPPPPPPTYG